MLRPLGDGGRLDAVGAGVFDACPDEIVVNVTACADDQAASWAQVSDPVRETQEEDVEAHARTKKVKQSWLA